MTNANALRSMTDTQMASFLTRLCTNPDWLDWLYRKTCQLTCPISGEKCLVHQQDDACQYSVADMFLQWLKTDSE